MNKNAPKLLDPEGFFFTGRLRVSFVSELRGNPVSCLVSQPHLGLKHLMGEPPLCSLLFAGGL